MLNSRVGGCGFDSWGLIITEGLKVAEYSFSGSIASKFEHKLRCHKQRFEKMAWTVVLDKDDNLL